MHRLLLASIFLAFFAQPLFAAPPQPPQEPPTVADAAYGPDPKQKLDIFLPSGAGPFPVILYFHGGGWFAGNRKVGIEEPAPYFKHGVALISVEYRLVDDANAEKISPPIVAVLGDARRALQYVRLHAADWHLDPNRIIAAGGSAGATTALFLACEGEQANPQSSDPVERVSTKVVGAAASAPATSVDPQHIHEWNPGCFWGYWAFEPTKNYNSGPEFQKFLDDREKWLPMIKKYSPEWLLSKDTPPLYVQWGQTLPPAGTIPPSPEVVHSPRWGVGFQKWAQDHGVTCYLQYPGHPPEKYKAMWEYTLDRLGIDPKK